ncbi:GNAT family N-acetyltransferase [Roseibium sp.]|uniref:GNAT family N-acetyltransferase n=1 Tax=Roseibium sp. TaxID=1936156 RepID=UPI003BAE9AC5
MTKTDTDRPAPKGPVVCLETISEAAADIEVWFRDEWPAWYGAGGQGDARRDLARCLHTEFRLPRCLVALNTVRLPVGTVSLRDSSPGSDRYPGAWLTALLVPGPFRLAGIGTSLVAAAEAEAARLGYSEILSSTATAQSLFLTRDWQRIDTFRYPSGELEIFRKVLLIA